MHVGAIARTDLFGPHLAVQLALEALRTLQVRLRGLPDNIAVFPTHGSGSFCGTGGRSGRRRRPWAPSVPPTRSSRPPR